MKFIIILLLTFFSSLISAQEDSSSSSVPTYYRSDGNKNITDKKKEIIFKTLDFIADKTGTSFLTRMKLKENDSIEFKMSYIIDKFGFIEKDSIKIHTPLVSFNNYMELIIEQLPRFTPAKNNNYESIPYKIEFTGRFLVKDNKLNHYQYEVERLFFVNIDKIPNFKGCESETEKESLDCFHKKMAQHINRHFNYPNKALRNRIQGIVSVQFTINIDGTVSNIITKGRDIENGAELLEKEAYRIISLLPKFTPAYSNGIPTRVKYGLPITFKLL
jgi:TonB family protein